MSWASALEPYGSLITHSVGLLFLWSAESIRKGTHGGLEGALGESPINLLQYPKLKYSEIGASALLFLSSLPRVTKGPIPVVLATTSAGTGLYYGNVLRNLRT